MLAKIFAIAAAGALGTLARYALAGLVHRLNATSFPWGTLAVNLSGCFMAGLLWSLFEGRLPVASDTRAIALIGFMGAFTTFSAYILETGELMRSAQWVLLTVNVAAQNGLGIIALAAGFMLGRIA
jgi:CrcB protein